jgi:hypothetical protein
MQTTPDKVKVAFRELGEGNLWRCSLGEPAPSAVLMCDIRRGRPPEHRARLAETLVAACSEGLALPPQCMIVHFTQHAGDEISVPSPGLVNDWTPAETHADRNSLMLQSCEPRTHGLAGTSERP